MKLIRNAQVAGRLTDIAFDSRMERIAQHIPGHFEQVIDAAGRAVLPGLHDHHLHFLAAARAATSVDLSRVAAGDQRAFGQLLSNAPGSGWIRGVGLHESLIDVCTASQLDEFTGERPARLQHGSGKMWLLNSAALAALDVDGLEHEGVERDAGGQPTGRLFRLDGWLRGRLEAQDPVDVAGYSRHLATLGITSFTDTSYTNNAAAAEFMRQRRSAGELLQRVLLMGDETLEHGHLKIILDEDALPGLDALTERIAIAHRRGRPVAMHCLTRLELLFALQALAQAGSASGDRLEHAALVPDDLLPMLADSGCCVVTQPGFVADRGERFRQDLPEQQHELYRYRTLQEAGIPVAASSDAPYGPVDPWLIMASAVTRRTDANEVLGPDECVSAQEALRGYLSAPLQPGGAARELAPGGPADLIVLDRTLEQALADPAAVKVCVSAIDGQVVYDSSDNTS